MTPDRQPLFHVRGLTKVYSGGEVEVRALDGVDLDLYEGEMIVLLGASGSGKSKLAFACLAAARRVRLFAALIADDQMGTLFKVMGLAAPGWPQGVGFEPA